MALELRKATRTKLKARIGMSGSPGSGKTYSSLLLAYGLCGDWGKIAIIDTEGGRGELYVNTDRRGITIGEYNCITLDPPFDPKRYIEAIEVCEQAGIEVIIVDSLSHAWMGTGGMLDLKDKLSSGNDFAAWKKVTPMHNSLVDKLLRCKSHIIVCTRANTEYLIEKDERGKNVPRKVGLKPQFREGLEFEMQVFFDVSAEHVAIASKDNTGLFDMNPSVVAPSHGKALLEWLQEGKEAPPAPEIHTPIERTIEPHADKNDLNKMTALCKEKGIQSAFVTSMIGTMFNKGKFSELTKTEAQELYDELSAYEGASANQTA